MTSRIRCSAVAAAVLLGMSASGARAQTVQELQQQIDELKAQIKALTAAQASVSPAAPVAAPEVTAPTPSPPDQTAGLKNRTGASAVALLDRASATGPACPIWALTAAPSAWTAAVRRCRPGTASGRIQTCLPSVRPPGLTAQ